jgi:hypothetical protein
VVIRPGVAHVGSGGFTGRHEAVLEGEKAALDAPPRIGEIVTRLREHGRIS